MSDRTRPFAGGLLLAFGLFAGSAAGVLVGEPSAGLVGGLILGGTAAAILAWRDRRS